MEFLRNIGLKNQSHKCCCCHNDNHDSCHDHCESENHDHSHGHIHNHEELEGEEGYKQFILPALSFILLISGLIIDHFSESFFNTTVWAKPLWYFIAFLPVGFSVVKEALEGVLNKDYFNELTLMSIACIGAFLIGEYAEAVGVMLFYSIGEILQDRAVDKATDNISKLLDVRPESARVVSGEERLIIKPEAVSVGEIIEVRPGERVPLDGFLENKEAMFDTAALTGESIPRIILEGEEVLAGMISSSSTVRIKVNRPYGESAISRILNLVKNAREKKAKSEVFIRKFARIYTPVVTLLAFLVVALPFLYSFITPSFHYIFNEWLYRALVFLVISCPCALVISVPLSYFAGIGAASKEGILFKGGNYLESIKNINTIAFDKTGTLTTGEFGIDEICSVSYDKNEFISIMASAEAESSHPLAKAVVKNAENLGIPLYKCSNVIEIPGKGTKSFINESYVLAGNLKLLREEKIPYPQKLDEIENTIIAGVIDGKFAGYIILSDTIKEDSASTVKDLKNLGVDDIVMLSGDKKEIVKKYAGKLEITESFGELLPENKASFVEKITNTPGKKIAFVGDGMNDAPVLALSDVGIAMGALGSDAAIESADIVIQTDRPSKVVTAIKIGRFTHKVVYENIIGALAVKIVVLALGLTGFASLWAAVFADVGVTLLAVLNSMRIMWKKY